MTKFVDLPMEFCPPERAADRLAELRTIAEREAYLARIPTKWHPMIGELAVHAIARRILVMREKRERQDAIASVPEQWRERVRRLVLSWWNTQHLRTEVSGEVMA